MVQMNLPTKQKQTYMLRAQTCGCCGGGLDWEFCLTLPRACSCAAGAVSCWLIPSCSVFPALSENDHRSQRNAILLGRANGKCQAATAGQARDVSASVYGAGEVPVFLLCQCSWCAHRCECPTLQWSAPLYSFWVCSLAFFLQALQGVPGK